MERRFRILDPRIRCTHRWKHFCPETTAYKRHLCSWTFGRRVSGSVPTVMSVELVAP